MDQEQNKFEKDLEQQSSDELPKKVESTPALSDAPQKEEPASAVTEQACDPVQKQETPTKQEPAITESDSPVKQTLPAPLEQSPVKTEPEKKKEKKEKKSKKEKKTKKQRRPRKKHYILRVICALLRFILTLLLGMAIAYGSVIGIFYYAFSGLTIDMLQQFGIAENADAYLTSNGDIDLTSTSILELIADLNSVRADLQNHTLDSLIAHYGIALPEETLAMLPTDLFSLPLDQLVSGDVGAVIAENLKMGYFLSLLPDEMLSPLLVETLSDRPLALLTSGAYGELFSGVKLGYLTGVTFDENGNVQYVDVSNPTLQEVLATLDLGNVLEAATKNGDLLGVFATDIGTQELRPLLGGIVSGALLDKMCEGLCIGDVILPDAQTGRYRFDLNALTGALHLGDVLGYTYVNDTWYQKYTDNGDGTDDVAATKMNAALADISLSDVLGGKLSLDESFEDLYFGDLQNGYTRGDAISEPLPDSEELVVVGYQWLKDGVALGKMQQELANIAITDLLNSKIDINKMLDTLTLGDVLGYTYKDTDEDGMPDTWYSGEKPAEGVMKSLVGLTLEDISNDEVLLNSLREITLADAMGYEKVDDTWYSKYSDDGDSSNDVTLTGILKVLAGKSLSEINSATIEGIALGDAVGYSLVDTNSDGTPDTWYNGDEPATGIMAKMADLTVAELKSSSAVADKLGEVQLFEVLNYKKVEGQWQSNNGQPASGVMSYLMEATVGDIEQRVNQMPLGYAFGFYYNANTQKWYADKEMTTEPAGITASLASICLGNAQAELESMQVGELLGYTYKDTDEDGTPDTWYQNGQPATGLTLVLAGLPLSDLGNGDKVASALQEAKLGESLGFKNIEGKWYKTKIDGTGNTVADMEAPVTGLIGALADTKIGSLETDTKTVKIGTMLEFTEEEGVWYDGNGNAVNGAVAVLAKSDLSTLSDNMNNMTVADLWPDSERKGILKAIDGTTKVSELDKAVQDCTIGALIEAEVLQVGTAQAFFFDVKMSGWRSYNVVDFINGLLKLDVFTLVP